MFADQNNVTCFVDQNAVTCFVDQNGIELCCGASGPVNTPPRHDGRQHQVHHYIDWQISR